MYTIQFDSKLPIFTATLNLGAGHKQQNMYPQGASNPITQSTISSE